MEEGTGEPRLSRRGPGFNIASWKVDGMDTLAVHLAMQEALEHMRSGKGPTLIEADVLAVTGGKIPIPFSIIVIIVWNEDETLPVIKSVAPATIEDGSTFISDTFILADVFDLKS